ncbi:hypothetical protein [Deinococcus fonticola]|uniref:hypothetical protein n=1 Tax=Deinococcus fonticola TaxID=2528713 RepID=UPI001074A4D6|nr:hypothetical protein [Deinococcus fonticola]
MMKKARLSLLVALGGLPLLLTACPRPVPYDPPVLLTFRLPEDAPANLSIAAVTYQLQDNQKVEPVVLTHGYVGGKTASISLFKSDLATLAKNTRCTTPFMTGEAKEMTNVTVNPSTVTTCNIHFVAYEDRNNDRFPTAEEERYITHDLYGYASSAFTYSMTTKDGKSTEKGTRTQGWSLVRHTVLQPSATPGKYVVTMNSVPVVDENLMIRLHEPTDFMTSMSMGGRR